MLTVIMECRDQELAIAQSLSGLVSGAVHGLVSDVLLLDHGSRDGTATLADATGCHFHKDWQLGDVLLGARGSWIMVIEPGARFQAGWIDEVADYIGLGLGAARFSPSRHYRRPFFQRFLSRRPVLEQGLLISKSAALAASQSGQTFADMARSKSAKPLRSELIPAWSLTSGA